MRLALRLTLGDNSCVPSTRKDMNSISLELHYHLKNHSHEMDAFVRNRCEAEALAAFSYIAERLGIELLIEVAAHNEGGLKDIWNFNCKPEIAWAAWVSVLAVLLPAAVNVWTAPPRPDKELESINKEIAKATLEEKRIAVEKARIELKNLLESGAPLPVAKPFGPASAPAALPAPARPTAAPPPPAKAAGRASIGYLGRVPVDMYEQFTVRSRSEQTVAIVATALALIADEPKFTTRRSNFFKMLLPYNKVTAFGLRQHSPFELSAEHVIERRDFIKFVLKTDKLPPEVVDEALITIVAPVIDASGMAWKGLYQDEPIAFHVKDAAFRDQVLHRRVSFQHGDAIRARLVIERKLDETGEEVVTGRSVEVVIEKIEGGAVTETPQGRKQRFIDKNAAAQDDLDFGGL